MDKYFLPVVRKLEALQAEALQAVWTRNLLAMLDKEIDQQDCHEQNRSALIHHSV